MKFLMILLFCNAISVRKPSSELILLCCITVLDTEDEFNYSIPQSILSNVTAEQVPLWALSEIISQTKKMAALVEGLS